MTRQGPSVGEVRGAGESRSRRRRLGLPITALATFALTFCPSAAAQDLTAPVVDPAPGRAAGAGDLLVRFTAGASASDARRSVVQVGGEIEDRLLLPDTYRVRSDEARTLSRLDEDPAVRWVEPLRRLELDAVTPSDPSFSAQQHLEAISAPEAWHRTTGVNETRIGILDTGVDLDHPDLVAGLDPGQDFTWEDDGTAEDEYGHGAHVAGIAAARTDNAMGVAGVAWEPRIVPLQVCDYTGGCWSDDIVDGLVWAGEHGVDVVNLSAGFNGKVRSIRDAIATVPEMTVVASAGNEGRPLDGVERDPCTASRLLPNVICAAATNDDGTLAPFSNFGKVVSIAAPGTEILSTFNDGGYERLSGTSMAAPIVTGAVALLKASHPGLSPAEIRLALEQGAPSPDLASQRQVGSRSRLDLVRTFAFLDQRDEDVASRSVPVTSGSPTVGHNLEVWTGQWTGTVERLSIQWERDAGASFEPIPDAVSRVYQLTEQDAGSRVRAVVTATGHNGSEAVAASSATAVISGEAPRQVAVEDAAYATITGAGGPETIQKVVPLGDVNGDGHEDLAVVECDEWDFLCGEVEVLLGPVRGDVDMRDLSTLRSFTVKTTAQGYFAPQISVSALGDFDGDGLDDFVISEDSGSRAYVILGRSNPRDLDLELLPFAGGSITIEAARSPNPYETPHPVYFQFGAFGPGDTNGDGYSDLVIPTAMPVDEPGNPAFIDAYASRTFVLYGGPAVEDTVLGPEVPAASGRMIDGIGEWPREMPGPAADFDHDGTEDLVFGSPGDTTQGIQPKVSVIYGDGPSHVDLEDLNPGEGWVLTGFDSPWLVPPIDVGNADGLPGSELIVGTYDDDEPSTSYVLPRPSDGRWIDLAGEDSGYGTALEGLNADNSGAAVDLADIDGDGIETAVVGQSEAAGLSRGEAGSVAVLGAPAATGVLGISQITPPLGLELIGETAGSLLGGNGHGADNVTSADLDGNGSEELILLAGQANRPEENEVGRVYLVSWASDQLRAQSPPLAAIGGPSEVNSGETVEVHLDEASDPEGKVKGIAWDLDGDGAFEVSGGTSQKVTLGAPGTHTVEVRVEDSEGAYGYDSLYMEVLEPPREPTDPVEPPDPPDVGEEPGGNPNGPSTLAPNTVLRSWKIERANRSGVRRLIVRFSSTQNGKKIRFECSPRRSVWGPCTSPAAIRLQKIRRRFLVRAVDSDGRSDPSAAGLRVRRGKRPSATAIP
jgi:hypothetical protein